MQKSTIINFCDSWIRRLESLTDIDFQKRVWFRLEGPEVSTFEEETGNIIQKYLDQQAIPQYQLLYTHECGELLKQLYEKVHAYTTDSNSLLNSVIEEQFVNDPNWLAIVSLAKKTTDALKRWMKQVEHDAKSNTRC